MQRSTPNMPMVSRITAPLTCKVQGWPRTVRPEIFHQTLGQEAKASMPCFQTASCSFDRSRGYPV